MRCLLQLCRVCVRAPQREQGLLREMEAEEVLCEEKRRRCGVEEQNLHQLEEQRRILQEQIDTHVEEVQRPIPFTHLLRGCTVTNHITKRKKSRINHPFPHVFFSNS